MKIASVLLCLAALAFGFIALQRGTDRVDAWEHPEADHLSGPVPAGYQVMRFEVDGMCCQSCPEKLRTWLGEVDGVKDWAVSFEDSCAEVVVPTDFDSRPLLETLNQDKYTARVSP